MIKLVALGVVGAVAVASLLPIGGDTGTDYAATATRAESRLIASIREMAQAPVVVADPVVAMREPTLPVESELNDQQRLQAAAATERLVVTADAVNLRANPSTSAEVLGRLLRGEAVEVANREDGWVQVATAAGATGWAYSDYLAVAQE